MGNIQKIEELKQEMLKKVEEIKDLNELNNLRVLYLGRKGLIQDLNNDLKNLPDQEKKKFGAALNNLKEEVEYLLKTRKDNLEIVALNERLESELLDISLPSAKLKVGNRHPITRIIEEIEDLFISMGYSVVEGKEIESDLYNFELLNIPKNHPARDMQDSFYIDDTYLLRTQTSSTQARIMMANTKKTPIRVICPGKVYRKDEDDKTHSHQFHQIEGLVVDKGISMTHLKATLEEVAKKMFGNDGQIRFRPSYFPFTEPSFEVDVVCFKCKGEGCSFCKDSGWIEILGSGMVHPNVLRECGYDPDVYTGFAFGMGPERIAILKYGIGDIREFYQNDIRFLEQFNRVEGGSSNESE